MTNWIQTGPAKYLLLGSRSPPRQKLEFDLIVMSLGESAVGLANESFDSTFFWPTYFFEKSIFFVFVFYTNFETKCNQLLVSFHPVSKNGQSLPCKRSLDKVKIGKAEETLAFDGLTRSLGKRVDDMN